MIVKAEPDIAWPTMLSTVLTELMSKPTSFVFSVKKTLHSPMLIVLQTFVESFLSNRLQKRIQPIHLVYNKR